MLDFLRERRSFIIVVVVLVAGFGFLLLRPSNPTTATKNKLPTEVSLSNPMTKGSASASVSLIQYSDFLCPSCAYFTTQMMPTIETEYIDTGKVKFEFRPMAFIAPGSTYAGAGAYCAVNQDKFWEFHDAVYGYTWNNAFTKGIDPTTTTILTEPLVESIAVQTGLDAESFSNCMSDTSATKAIASATTTANNYGITSTPYILVNGHKVEGNFTLDTIQKLIEAQL